MFHLSHPSSGKQIGDILTQFPWFYWDAKASLNRKMKKKILFSSQWMRTGEKLKEMLHKCNISTSNSRNSRKVIVKLNKYKIKQEVRRSKIRDNSFLCFAYVLFAPKLVPDMLINVEHPCHISVFHRENHWCLIKTRWNTGSCRLQSWWSMWDSCSYSCSLTSEDFCWL